jgi:hypothetical protein
MSLVHDLIVGTLDASQYEDACRALLGEMLLASTPDNLHKLQYSKARSYRDWLSN